MAYIDFTGFEHSVYQYIRYVLGKKTSRATKRDMFNAVSSAVRKYLIDMSFLTEERYLANDAKRLHYISLEYLTGRLLSSNLINLGIYDECRAYLKRNGWVLEELEEEEPHPALGNGGLGRLAACFLDSLASLDMPGFGYGINYDYGLFRQRIVNGYQKEEPDYWPNRSSPWLIGRAGKKIFVPIYGRIADTKATDGEYNPVWMEWQLIVGRPHDILIAGYDGNTVNRLRLFSAWASGSFDINIFNDGDYFKAVENKIKSESISKILYPSDSKEAGKELRLVQEYFLVACSVQDIIRIYLKNHDDFNRFPEKTAIQLNDTHPALTVAELMRALIDQHGLSWEKAWETTTRTLAYTNHTLLPEALEKWPLKILERVIPRHLQIIYEINQRFIDTIHEKYPDNEQIIKRVSIIEEGEATLIRMANLAIIGSHSVNGVSEIHSRLVKESLVPDFYKLYPQKFNNKTNGVTHRRWIGNANRNLTALINETIGRRWLRSDFAHIRDLEPYREDPAFLERLGEVKRANKVMLSNTIKSECGIATDPDTIFDVHIKRIHEYKRQLLNLMNIIYTYFRIKDHGVLPPYPRTFVFSGKAAPGYIAAKLIIKLIHCVADVVNRDDDVNEWLKVVFIPDYRVSVAEKIIPAADVSEQISTAGMEASGTGNMKLTMNGALTVGTLDGANIEISREVGEDNIYMFGLTVEEVMETRKRYDPGAYMEKNPDLKRAVEAIGSGFFSAEGKDLFKPLFNILTNQGDYYLHLADFQSYARIQEKIAGDFADRDEWLVKSLLNISRSSKFSSDRTVREYAEDIWGIKPYPPGK